MIKTALKNFRFHLNYYFEKQIKCDYLKFLAIVRYFYRKNKGNLGFIFIIYIIGGGSLLLANFNFIDDNDRTFSGIFGFDVWSRYLAGAFSGILQVNTNFLVPIFPYSLLVSFLFLSLSSLILLKIIDKRLLDSKVAIITSSCVGLFPYFLENLSYKFDSPFMTLSVLCAILPFAFLRLSKISFFAISIICLFCVLTTYQASNGIYIILSIFLINKILQSKAKMGCFSAFSLFYSTALSYISACIIFIFSVYKNIHTYASNEMLPIQYLIIGTAKHLYKYYEIIFLDFYPTALFPLMLAFGLIFVIKNTLDSKLNTFASFSLNILSLTLMLIFAFGIYIFLIIPLFFSRAFIGFGVLIAILALNSITLKPKMAKILSYFLSLILVEHIFVFANFYGTSLINHNEYESFRVKIVANDLANVLRSNDLNLDSKFNIPIYDNSGLSPFIINSRKHYPLIERIIPNSFSQTNYIERYLLAKYGIFSDMNKNNCAKLVQNGAKVSLLVDNYYHKIERINDNVNTCYKITLKPSFGIYSEFK